MSDIPTVADYYKEIEALRWAIRMAETHQGYDCPFTAVPLQKILAVKERDRSLRELITGQHEADPPYCLVSCKICHPETEKAPAPTGTEACDHKNCTYEVGGRWTPCEYQPV